MIVKEVKQIIVVIIILIVFILFNLFMKRHKLPIDIVYTWVDNDPKIEQFLGKEEYISARYTNNDEILYSLRSVEKYMPWINHIYLVVHDGQKPKWLKENNSKLTIIPHSKIIPSQYLPTFNSICIESFLHKIPNLSEHYIYLNDDIIILNPISRYEFFDIWGRTIESNCSIIKTDPKFTIENYNYNELEKKEYSFPTLLQFNNYILNNFLKNEEHYTCQHIPSPNRISYQESLDSFLDTLKHGPISLNEHTKQSKNRKNTNIARISVFKKYWNKNTYNSPQKSWDYMYIPINHIESKKKDIELIPTTDKLFLCVQNEIHYPNPNKNIGIQDFELLKKVLNQKFPNKSSFEN